MLFRMVDPGVDALGLICRHRSLAEPCDREYGGKLVYLLRGEVGTQSVWLRNASRAA